VEENVVWQANLRRVVRVVGNPKRAVLGGVVFPAPAAKSLIDEPGRTFKGIQDWKNESDIEVSRVEHPVIGKGLYAWDATLTWEVDHHTVHLVNIPHFIPPGKAPRPFCSFRR
jgi:hypothetical protein